MSASTPLVSKDQLIAYFEKGCKSPSQWRLGIEDEKFIFHSSVWKRADYSTLSSLLTFFVQEKGWIPVTEQGNIIGLTYPQGQSVSLEPGGQLEFASAPLSTLHEVCEQLKEYQGHLLYFTQHTSLKVVNLGVDPVTPLSEMPWMPKERYRIMRGYMPEKGNLGLSMMTQTCTSQVNVDYASESDMVEKFRVSLALQPLITALFSNSCLVQGKTTDFESYRSHIWTDTDPDRCGMLPFVFDSGMGFERYVDYVLDVPMYFLYREGRYQNVAGQSFRQLLEEGKVGEADWENHITTVFPEVRLKKYLEMRGADAGTPEHVMGLAAFWMGVLYDSSLLNHMTDVISLWPVQDLMQLRQDVPRQGLHAKIGGKSLISWAKYILPLVYQALKKRNLQEESYLEPLLPLLEQTQSSKARSLYQPTGSLEDILENFTLSLQ